MGKAPDSRFSDYVDLETVKRRAKRSLDRGDTYELRVVDVVDRSGKSKRIKFRDNFNVFADAVAYELRRKIYYRTDGGHFARGLVRANGHLKIVHGLYNAHGYKDGDTVNIMILLVRRKDKKPPNRWTMDVLYKVLDFEDFSADIIIPDKDKMQKMRCERLDELFNVLDSVMPMANKKQRKEIQGMMDVAERVGCPRSVDLWYYNRLVMKEFIHWRTKEQRRKDMTAKTRGRPPMMGHTFPHGNWRILPFDGMIRRFGLGSMKGREMELFRFVEYHRQQIVEGLKDINRELDSTSLFRGTFKMPWSSDEWKIYGIAKPFFKSMEDIRKDKNHLYSVF